MDRSGPFDALEESKTQMASPLGHLRGQLTAAPTPPTLQLSREPSLKMWIEFAGMLVLVIVVVIGVLMLLGPQP